MSVEASKRRCFLRTAMARSRSTNRPSVVEGRELALDNSSSTLSDWRSRAFLLRAEEKYLFAKPASRDKNVTILRSGAVTSAPRRAKRSGDTNNSRLTLDLFAF